MFSWISPALKATDDNIRMKFAEIIRSATRTPKSSLKRIIAKFSNQPIQAIAAESYMAGNEYLLRPIVLDYMKDNKCTENETKSEVSTYNHITEYVTKSPILHLHLHLLGEVIATLNDARNSSDEPLTMREFVSALVKNMDAYAKSYDLWIDSFSVYDNATFLQVTGTTATWTPHEVKHYYVPHGQDPSIIDEHKQLMETLLDIITDQDLPDDRASFVLTQFVSTAGLATLQGVKFPFFVNLFPPSWYEENANNIWEKRMIKIYGEEADIPDPSSFGDSEQREMADSIARALDNDPFVNLGDVPGERLASTDNDNERKEKEEEEDEEQISPPTTRPPSPDPSTTQPTIPDDTSYVPEQELYRKVKDLTEWLRTQDTIKLKKDHMTRFGVQVEEQRSVRKIDLLPTDTRIIRGQNTLGQMYMVTFTRKSKKPIFNPVS
jgi:hypothetical protein